MLHGGMPHATRCTPHAARHMPRAACHAPHATCLNELRLHRFEQQILRLHIPMHHPPIVHELEGRRDLHRRRGSEALGESPLPDHHVDQRAAPCVLHHEVNILLGGEDLRVRAAHSIAACLSDASARSRVASSRSFSSLILKSSRCPTTSPSSMSALGVCTRASPGSVLVESTGRTPLAAR